MLLDPTLYWCDGCEIYEPIVHYCPLFDHTAAKTRDGVRIPREKRERNINGFAFYQELLSKVIENPIR